MIRSGLMHVNLGGLHVGDIEFSAAFDEPDRVGRILAAIFADPNNTSEIRRCSKLGVPVHPE
jgi:myo-inositol-1-phosphate synthase